MRYGTRGSLNSSGRRAGHTLGGRLLLGTLALVLPVLLAPSSSMADACASGPRELLDRFVTHSVDPEALETLLADDYHSESRADVAHEGSIGVSSNKNTAIEAAEKLVAAGATAVGTYDSADRIFRTSVPNEWVIEDVRMEMVVTDRSGESYTLTHERMFVRVRERSDGCYELVELVVYH